MKKETAWFKNKLIKLGKTWGCCTLVLFLCYAMLIMKHYSIDSYAEYWRTGYGQFFAQGRFVTGIFMQLLGAMGLNAVTLQPLFTMFFIAAAGLCAASIWLILRYYMAEKADSLWVKIGLWTAVFIMFVNVSLLEWLLFPELAFPFALALISSTGAALLMGVKSNVKSAAAAILLLTVAFGCYQICIEQYLILALLVVVVRHKLYFSKSLAVEMLWIIGTGGLAAGINVVIQKFSQSGLDTRSVSLSLETLLKNAQKVLKYQKQIWVDGYGLMQRGTVIGILCIVLAALLFFVIKGKLPVAKQVTVLVLLVAGYGAIWVPHMVTSDAWILPRTVVGVYWFIAMVLVLALYSGTYKFFEKILVILSVGFGLICAFNVQNTAASHIATNKLDAELARAAVLYIQEYETENSTQITKLAFCDDAILKPKYSSVVYQSYDINIPALNVTWGRTPLFNYVLGEERYTSAEMDATVYAQYFEGKNWNYFNPSEQIVFVGDTAYIAIY
ncbi:MAG: glucosyltransferase domain-containing protein [Oscillospiraceae bacterium]|nr:glucosyltransferase domain-containing protein [Oscillospiraceae bacterium]